MWILYSRIDDREEAYENRFFCGGMECQMENELKNKYGYFSSDGREFVITDPRTPKPWINVLTNGEHSALISQMGGGYSWRLSAQQFRITRMYQDLVKDQWGKYVYIRDTETGEFWSAAYKPVMCDDYEDMKIRHGIGYTIFEQLCKGIKTSLKIFVTAEDPVEIMELTIENCSERARTIDATTYFEWEMGQHPNEHREFTKIFMDHDYDEAHHAIIVKNHLSPYADEKGRHNNQDWPYIGFHAVSETPKSYTTDKETFLGMYGHESNPAAMHQKELNKTLGRFGDSAAALQVEKTLKPGEHAVIVFTLGTADKGEYKIEDENTYIEKYTSPEAAKKAFAAVQAMWSEYIDTEWVETPDTSMNLMTNIWMKYQTIAGRLWGRSAYYQTNGGAGFRDQLQDSQIYLINKPQRAKERLLEHAAHQYEEGDVLHWWLAMRSWGPRTRCSDDLLWLPYILDSYLRETGDYDILDEVVPFFDQGEADLYEHCKRSIEVAFKRMSPRGIALMGDHDWNDGLSAVGREWKGESFWVSEFLYTILESFIPLAQMRGDDLFVDRMKDAKDSIQESFNKYAWDGEWFMQATTDEGRKLGSHENEEGKIFLMPNIWAVMTGIADEEKGKKAMESVTKYLLKDYGALLNYPAFTQPRRDIGYVTRYAPGLRENGGVYTHAATWAVWAYAKLGDAENAYKAYSRICPANRMGDPDVYKAEPYVTPGNIDGPLSPFFGRGGWTWYSGSSQWLHRVATQWILGIRPDYDGLIVDPCIPKQWDGFTYRRTYNGSIYHITVQNPEHVSKGVKTVLLDGEVLKAHKIPDLRDGAEHQVTVILG